MQIPQFLPVNKKELTTLEWEGCDIILISGDAYIDSPWNAVALLGKHLVSMGFKVGVLSQPDPARESDFKELGQPRLFWGIAPGCVDSMVANYTASLKRRRQDDFTPGGVNHLRPDRASLVYTRLLKKIFPTCKPIVLGGVEASLRRVSHYDFYDSTIHPSVLYEAKAEILVYGMGEKTIFELAQSFDKTGGKMPSEEILFNQRGICYISNTEPENAITLPPHEAVIENSRTFEDMFALFSTNTDSISGKRLSQQIETKFLIQNPPQTPLSSAELDALYALPFAREVHPLVKKKGKVLAIDTIRFSIPTHRGCYGQCSFCAISVHQGRLVQGRSIDSIVAEAESFNNHKHYKGIISDLGGPTANMYGFECSKKRTVGSCLHKHCLYPKPCPSLKISHGKQLDLLTKLRGTNGVRKVFIASGIRPDIILADPKFGNKYLETVLKHHTSGQMKVAPEHTSERVLSVMRKPSFDTFLKFHELFKSINKRFTQKRYLTYYLMAAHPGCGDDETLELEKRFKKEGLSLPEQVQIFTPTPSTWSTVMYVTGRIPGMGKRVFVIRNLEEKEEQKRRMTRTPAMGPVPSHAPGRASERNQSPPRSPRETEKRGRATLTKAPRQSESKGHSTPKKKAKRW